ncbi:MAG TPA: PEP-CTERM sorting domain-containing protein [Phycisphaerae bacterium]|nr:PEP-CTERM sorting domain-containing protein [Phycisphaerae bacterium]
MSRSIHRVIAGLIVGVLFAATPAAFAVTPVDIVIKQGDVFGARTVSTLNAPFTDGLGKVGFVAAFDDSTRGIWHSSGFVFNSSDALPDSLTGGEGTMGVSNLGNFIYSPSFNGGDAVYTAGGKLLADGDAVPNNPGLFSVFNSRPTMLPNGTAHWIGGTSTTAGGSTSNRHLFRATDPNNPMSISRIISGGDVIEGKAISTAASNFNYDISDNGSHHVHILDMVTGSTTNNVHVYRDGAFVAQESLPVGDGTNWENFDGVFVNNAGDWLLHGDTSGATTSDEFIAFKGEIKVREGQTIDGITLASGASVNAASIDNKNNVVHTWGWGSGTTAQEHLFFGDADDLINGVRLLSRNDQVDSDGDTIADWIITDFEASTVIGPGLDLAEDGFVFVEVSMIPAAGGTEIGAILRVEVPEPATVGLLALGLLAIRRRRR